VKTVAIFGVGLIGGSFALAIRRTGFRGAILGVGSQKTLARARELGAIDQASTAKEAAAEADLIFLAQPVQAILTILPELASVVRPSALVTDAGSTKAAISEAGKKAFSAGNFLGGHPLAGKERRGIDAADANLFVGRTWVLTPDFPEVMERPVVKAYLDVLLAIGALPVSLPAMEHDRILALTSHLPQLASTALSAALSSELPAATVEGRPLFGPALLDSTRLALSPFSVWGDILATNREHIRAALQSYILKLQQFANDLNDEPGPDLEHEFQVAAQFSRLLRPPRD